METGDETLAGAAATGDRAALGTLIDRHYDRIFRLAWRVLGNRADAEDVAQDICIALPARLGSFRGQARFTTWLHTVTLNAARDLIRRQVTRSRATGGWAEAEVLRQAESDAARAELDWLAAAMQALKPDLRETVALVLGEELTHAEAAAVLGVSEGTVSWRMSEVKKALRARAGQDRV